MEIATRSLNDASRQKTSTTRQPKVRRRRLSQHMPEIGSHSITVGCVRRVIVVVEVVFDDAHLRQTCRLPPPPNHHRPPSCECRGSGGGMGQTVLAEAVNCQWWIDMTIFMFGRLINPLVEPVCVKGEHLQGKFAKFNRRLQSTKYNDNTDQTI